MSLLRRIEQQTEPEAPASPAGPASPAMPARPVAPAGPPVPVRPPMPVRPPTTVRPPTSANGGPAGPAERRPTPGIGAGRGLSQEQKQEITKRIINLLDKSIDVANADLVRQEIRDTFERVM